MEVRSGTWQIAAGIFPHKSFSGFSLDNEKYRGVQYSTTETLPPQQRKAEQQSKSAKIRIRLLNGEISWLL
jgi:hypothetical protein